MQARGRHQSTSKECRRVLRRVEALDGVVATIIGRSCGGKSLGKEGSAGTLRIQREMPGGLKAVMQTEKGLQEIFIRTEDGATDSVRGALDSLV